MTRTLHGRLPRWRHALCVLACGWAFSAQAAVEVNRASLAELEAVTGIGTAMAERIVEARRRAAFSDWRDLIARVRGLGPASAAALSNAGLVVEGLPYAGPAAPRAARSAAQP
jgi:competence protein ComEA